MWFDAKAALKKLEILPPTPATPATFATPAPKNQSRLADVAEITAAIPLNPEKPDIAEFEERAAICEYDGGLSRGDAEQLAAECQGYSNVIDFKAARWRSDKQ